MFTFGVGADKDLKIRDGALVRVSGVDAVRRWLEHVLLSVQGDWFETDADGIPYFDESSPDVLVARIRAAAQAIPDILEVTELAWHVSGSRLIVDRLKYRLQTGAEGALASLNVSLGG